MSLADAVAEPTDRRGGGVAVSRREARGGMSPWPAGVVCRVIALLGAVLFATSPLQVVSQGRVPVVRLPNPDGADPVFDTSRRAARIEIAFNTLHGNEALTLADRPARIRVVNFWATWCRPCVRELPSLSRLAGHYRDDELRVVAVSLDRLDSEVIAEFLSSLEVENMDWFVDPSRTSGKSAGVVVLPTSVIVDAEGQELGRIVGSVDWESAEVREVLDGLVALRPAN